MTQVHKEFELVGEEFKRKLESLGEEQREMMHDSGKTLQAFLETIQHKQNESNEKSQALDEQRQQALTDTMGRISEQFNQFNLVGEKNTQAAENVVRQQQSVTENIEKVSNNLLTFAGMIEGVTEQLKGAAKEIKEGNQGLAKSSELMANTVSEASQSNIRVSQSNLETKNQLERLLDVIETSRNSAQEISNQLLSSAEAGKEIFNALQSHQQAYQDALKKHVEELAEQLSGSLEQYALKVKEQTHQRMYAWNEETIQYTGAMQGVVSAMQELVDDMDNKRTP